MENFLGNGGLGLPKIVLRRGHVNFREWSRKRDYHRFVIDLALGFHIGKVRVVTSEIPNKLLILIEYKYFREAFRI